MPINWYRESDYLIHINLLKLCNYKLKFTNSSLQLERRVSVWKPIDTCQKNLDYHRKGWFITVLFHWHITWVYERFDCFITVLILLRAILMISHVFLSFRVPFLWYHMGVWMIQLVYYSFGPFACHTYDITCVLVLSRAILMISHGCVNDSVGLLQFWFFVDPNDTSIFVFIVNVFLWLCNSYLTNGPSRIVLYLHCVWDILNVISLKDT